MHGESAFINSARALGYSCVVVRYQNIIGPNMGFRHAIPHIVERMLVGNEIFFKVYGSSQTRAFCHVSDAVNGTIGAMECYSMAGEIYHIGNDQEVTIGELTREVGRLLGYQGEYVDAMTYPGSVGRRCPDISKCYQHFGYKPVIDWKNAVADTVNWYFKFFSAGGKPLSGGFIPPERYSV
jgi:nucleoside-diphosphate-sugar epimerase